MFLNGELYVISAMESQTYDLCQKYKKVLILKKLEFESVGEILGFLHIPNYMWALDVRIFLQKGSSILYVPCVVLNFTN